MIDVVGSLEHLIEQYSLKEVVYALEFISKYPTPAKKYAFPNPSGATWFLTEDQFQQIEATKPRVNKIQAIKLFREITLCGLKEAKDAIEGYYDIGYRY